MKKLIILITLLTGVIATCSAQNRKTPILILKDRDRIAFYTDMVDKPTYIIPIFTVKFTHTYYPGDSSIIVKSVKLREVGWLQGKTIDSIRVANNDVNQLERYIWTICNGFIKEWMKDKQYVEFFESMTIPEPTIGFAGNIYAIPLLPTPKE